MKGRVERGVCLANVVSEIQCASITHPTENAYLPVYVSIHLHHLICMLHINQNVKEVVTKNLRFMYFQYKDQT